MSKRQSNNPAVGKPKNQQPLWVIILQCAVGIIIAIEVVLLIRGYTSNDSEMLFFWTAPHLILVGSLILSFVVKGWLRWIWVGLTILVAIIILIVVDLFSNLDIQY